MRANPQKVVRWLPVVAVVVVIGYLIASRQQQGFPDADLWIRQGQTYEVEILRDAWGVPHVFGRTDADAGYGLAYAHAEDDFATIQGALLAARGRLAAVFGSEAAPNDYMVRLLRIDEVVAQGYARLDSATQALCRAYADGLNHYAALHPDDAIPELYPITGPDVVRGFVHKTPLFFGLDATLRELFTDGDAAASSTPETTTASAFFRMPDHVGSNAFAVNARRSADGSTFLAVNSHQPWTGPVAWYEAHVHSEEGWDMVGGTFPGSPVILHGHNQRLGWAHTVNHPDLIDVYALDIDPQNPNRYRFDGEWRELEVDSVDIEVRLFGPVRWTARREVLWSVYGPTIRRPDGTYAIRFAGYGETRQVEQWYRMNKATTFDGWQEAVRMQAVPMFNIVYADAEGTIYYLYNARLPQRAPGYDWQALLPGDTSATLWTEMLPFDDLPQVLNPVSGFVQNANSTPYRTTTGPGNPDPADVPASLGIETRMTNRALRALELFGRDTSITEDEFQAYKYDLAYASDSRMAHLIRQARFATPPPDSLTREALAVLRQWDRRTDKANPHAALPILAFRAFLDTDAIVPTDTLLASLRRAAQTLHQHHGSLTVPWGNVNRLRRGDLDLPLGGGPDVLHAIYGELSDDGRLIGQAGDSYVLLARWTPEGDVHSRSIHVFGSATLDESSPHYADQARLFANRQLKPVWMERDAW